MQTLETKNQKRNLKYILDLIKYFLKTGDKPPFEKFILEDTTFLSLVKNIYVAGIIYLSLKKYDEFKGTWLKKELKKYYQYYLKQEEDNKKSLKDIDFLARKNKKILLLRDIKYKRGKNYIPGTRFSSDTDIQIKRNDLFEVHNFLRKRGYLLQNSDFDLIYKPHLYTDGFYDLKKTSKNQYHKKELIEGIKKKYRTFNYYKNSFLEVHLPSQNNFEIDSNLLWKFVNKTNKQNIFELQPEIDILSQANHFFLHLNYNEKQKNRLRTFLGFLERLVDLSYILKQDINWDKVLELSVKNKISHQTYYYLLLGKKYLNLDVPSSILKSLKKKTKFKHKLGILLLNNLNILKDTYNFKIRIYSKKFLKNKKRKKERLNGRKERKIILEILSGTKINEPYKKPLKKYNSKIFLNLIKETALDGLLYYKLKENSSFSKDKLKKLKRGYEGIKLFDEIQESALKKIEKIPIEKILIKEWKHKLSRDYIQGTRYSCDIDFLVSPENIQNIDFNLEKKGFYSDSIELELPEKLKNFSWNLNKNAHKIKDYNSNLLFYIKQYLFEKKDLKENLIQKENILRNQKINNLENSKRKFLYYSKILEKEYSNKINRILKIELNKDKSVNYYSNKGAYIDIHTKLFNPNKIFNVSYFDLDLVKKSKHNFILSLEDNIIVNSCHFINNLEKYKEKYGFQGFLKYLLDLKYENLSKINYSKLVKKSKKIGCSTQVWFYLSLAKKHLKINVPNKVLNKLYNDSWILQRFLLNLINEKKLLFNKRSIGVFLYSKTYFENKSFAKIMAILTKLVRK